MADILSQKEIEALLSDNVVTKMSRLTINISGDSDTYVQDQINAAIEENKIIIEHIIDINDYFTNDTHKVFVYYKEYV